MPAPEPHPAPIPAPHPALHPAPGPVSDPARAFRRGLVAALPFVVMIVPFSLIFGVVARDAGLDLLQVFAMSVIVVAGTAQFTALALMTDHAPVFVALAASLAVNLRMAMYSAALAPHVGAAPLWQRALMAYAMIDQVYAVVVRRYEDEPAMPLPDKVAFYLGNVIVVCLLWYAGTIAGALIGHAIPPGLGADFAVPVCFIALLGPLLRDLAHVVAAFVSALGAVVFAGLPWNLGLLAAALVAMVAGAQTERALARRRAAR